MFKHTKGEEQNEFSPLFFSILNHAPNKQLFLGDFHGHLLRGDGNGSLTDQLARRRTLITELAKHEDPQVRNWAINVLTELDHWIEHFRERDRNREESFE